MSVEADDRTRPELDTVLVAVGNRDDTRVDALVEAIREIAPPNDATVIIAHVFDSSSFREAVEQLLEAPSDDVEPDELAGEMTITREIVEQLEADSLDCVPRATMGRSGKGIVSIATDVDADRVVVGGRQRSPAGKAIFGSAAQEVMLHAPCPVTFVRNQTDQ